MTKLCFAPALAGALQSSRSAFATAGSRLCAAPVARGLRAAVPRMTAAAPEATAAMLPPLVDLRGKKALVTGIANNRSIAWGITQQLHAAGAEIGVAFLPMNEKVEGKVCSTLYCVFLFV